MLLQSQAQRLSDSEFRAGRSRSFVAGLLQVSLMPRTPRREVWAGPQAEQEAKRRGSAEGIENRADWDFVRRSGCDLAQGYFIAKPMPAADLVKWLADWEKRLCAENLTRS